MSETFLNRLKNYLDERLKNEVLIVNGFKPFEIETHFPSGSRRKWEVFTQGWVTVGSIKEFLDGTVVVGSASLDRAGDGILEHLSVSYRRKLGQAEISKEEEKKAIEVVLRRQEEVCEDYLHRRNLEKHLKKPYWRTFVRLLWFDEVARRISEEYGVKVEAVVYEVTYDCGLESKFDGTNMDEDKKFEEIKKRVEALIAAYKLAYTVYQDYAPERYKECLEFAKAVLEKYGIKRRLRL
ncbi:MAG: hypothetical protein FGF50_00780 [Candidatus Brockarchaeota archaeon]|nr:hypothetical protein [Candidatus Brockarchaeota archaeon]